MDEPAPDPHSSTDPPTDTSVLTIGGLARATGIPADTLRTWERRYGRPIPHRLPSGHRRYTFPEIAHLSLVREGVSLGQPPSTLLLMDEASLMRLLESLRRAPAAGPPPGRLRRTTAGPARDSVSAWIRAVEEAELGVLEAGFAREWDRLGPMGFLTLRVGPLLREAGRRRTENRFTIAEEHLVSEGLQAFLSAKRIELARTAAGPVAVCATPPGEPHALGLHQAALVLAASGWRVGFLGTGVPAAEVAAWGSRVRARAAVVVASEFLAPAAAREYLSDLRARLDPAIDLAVGGTGALPVDGALRFEDLAALRSWADRGGR